MDLTALRQLADRWREEAERYEADGVPGHAAWLRRVADELTETLGKWWTEPLGLVHYADLPALSARDPGGTRATQDHVDRALAVPNRRTGNVQKLCPSSFPDRRARELVGRCLREWATLWSTPSPCAPRLHGQSPAPPHCPALEMG